MEAIIQLSRGMTTVIDAADLPLVAPYPWHALRSGARFRPASSIKNAAGKHRTVLMYRHLLGALKGDLVDHINGDPMDNRRGNLRITTHLGNAWNRKGMDGTSRFKGVSLIKDHWFARAPAIRYGPFASEEEAARFYDKLANEALGAFARLNVEAATA